MTKKELHIIFTGYTNVLGNRIYVFVAANPISGRSPDNDHNNDHSPVTVRKGDDRQMKFKLIRRFRVFAHFINIAAVLLVAIMTTAASARLLDEKTLNKVVPGATGLDVFTGQPPSAAAFKDGHTLGYVFYSRLVIGSTGYSGKPLNLLIGLDLDGRITGAFIVEHHEPILEIGVSKNDLNRFVDQHRGLDIRNPIRIERVARPGEGVLATISGASISAVILSDTILRSARIVARQRGIIKGGGGAAFQLYTPATWPELVADGSIVHRVHRVGEVMAAFTKRSARVFPEGVPIPKQDAVFIELYAGLATVARVGRNLFGEQYYNRLLSRNRPGDHIVFVSANGFYSFKGTAWRRSGTFDRIQIVQGDRTIVLKKEDHIGVDRIRTDGAPVFREMAVFVLRADTGFVATEPWRLDLGVHAAADTPSMPLIYALNYRLPDKYRSQEAQGVKGETTPIWLSIWHSNVVNIAILILILVALSGILFFQSALAQRRRLFNIVRSVFLLFTLVWIGWYAVAQLTVLNVLVFAEALRTKFSWDNFLIDPLIYILWGFVALTLLFWGRGVYCGWLCPFGALQDLLNKAAQLLRVPQITVPFALHERLWPLKYIIFIGLFGMSLGGLVHLAIGAEVEPFKTAIVLWFNRAWPFVAYALALLGIGLFINRFFCRYICPLGGALAFPSRLRMFEWLERRWQCGIQCQRMDCLNGALVGTELAMRYPMPDLCQRVPRSGNPSERPYQPE
jgi:transcriptional regulator of nitric oxide reductase